MISGDRLDRQRLHLLGFGVAEFCSIVDGEAHQGFTHIREVGDLFLVGIGIPCAEDGDCLLGVIFVSEDNDRADIDGSKYQKQQLMV